MAKGQIIVTGASKGIGAAIASELAKRGVDVVCLSRTGDAPAGRGLSCDVTDENAVREAFAEVGSWGPVSGLINNAGVHVAEPIAQLSVASYERTMSLNATAVMVVAREAYPLLKENGDGIIVNIGSFFDKLGVPGNLAYCASKAAVAAMSRCMAVEWARDGIRVVNIAPGYIATDLNQDFLTKDKVRAWLEQRIPVGGPGAADEVARLVSMLCIERIGFLTGETIYVDGGQGMNH